MQFKSNRDRGLTLIEVLIIIVVIALLVRMLITPKMGAEKKALRINCVNNLKQVGLAFRIWSGDHGDEYPMAYPTNLHGTKEYITTGQVFWHFRSMSNELGSPKVLACPADSRKPAKSFTALTDSNISYFIGVDAQEIMPQMILSGDRNLAINGAPVAPGLVLLKSNDVVSWTTELHHERGNMGVADGSVQQVTAVGLQKMNSSTGTNLNRLVVP